MIVTLRKVAALLAAGGILVGLIGSGAAAQFTDQIIASENIDVGTFACQIVSAAPESAVVAPDGKSVTYSAPTIMSSAPSSAPFSFAVKNTGSIGQLLGVSTSPVAAPFSIIGAPFGGIALSAGASHTFDTGVSWTELGSGNLGQGGTVTWTVDCNEGPAFGVGYYVVNNGGTQFDPGTWVRSAAPISSTALVSGGTATQSVSGGALHLAISGNSGYADNGFYVPLGSLSSLAASGYTAKGTGFAFGTNVYFDVDNDGEFFGWTNASLSSIAPDMFGLGPTSAGGTLTVAGSSAFALTCNGSYGDHSLTDLASGTCTGITGATKVAVWIGITSTGAQLDTTITSAP